MIRQHPRRGFTLVEMLVVMGIIVLLTAAAMLIVPSALDRNRSTDAVTTLRGWLEIAQARAARDGAPRGVRLIVDLSKPHPTSNPASFTGSEERLWITEAQYIEAPPVLVFNPNPPYPNSFVTVGSALQPHPHTPRVEFSYTVAPTGSTTPPAGTVTGRVCMLRGLDANQVLLVTNSMTGGNQPTLSLPVLGTWHRIIGVGAQQQEPNIVSGVNSFFVELTLDHYPDTELGASTFYVTHHFGIYGPPRPLLGEPTMQLPTNTCVDLNQFVSSPAGVVTSDYDILFAPSGSLAFSTTILGDPHVFLCVRDFRKGSPMNLFDPLRVREGGEMMILAIKSRSGAIAVQPVDYAGDPYSFAKQSVSGQ
jgi:prepilin-type N-terminal cleavage/methylation domain-containing protein